MADLSPDMIDPDEVVDRDPKTPFVVGGTRSESARKNIEAAWLQRKLVRVTPGFHEQLPWISGPDRDAFLRSHPGYIHGQILESIRVSLEGMRTSLKGLLSSRYELIVEAHRFSSRDPNRNDRIAESATKEFFTFLALSAAQVDMYRRLRKYWSGYGDIVDKIVSSEFSDTTSKVVKILRNHYTHVLLSELSWSTSTQFGKGKDRHDAELILDAEKLVQTGSFGQNEQDLIRAAAPLEPVELFAEYIEKAQKLWNVVATYSNSGADPYIQNLRDTESAICAVNSRQTWKVVLQNFLGKKGIGVYQNLYRFYTDEEVSSILRRPDHSEAQADFAIALKDTYDACDAELREGIRAMFRHARPRNGP